MRKALKVEIPVKDFKIVTIPGTPAKLGVCYVKVTDLPETLENYMSINPRVPNRTKAGVLSGPVAKGILETLRDRPAEMAVMNQGIYLLVEEAGHANGAIQLVFTDQGKHGIINGGHTYSAIREAIDTAEGEELASLQNAYVRLHVFQGIDVDLVPDIAEGLNRSKQVDDPSLANLQGEFDIIRKALKGVPGESEIAYHQGDSGSLYISELLVYLELFNTQRFDDRMHPHGLYNKQSLGLKYFQEDIQTNKAQTLESIKLLPDILWLADSIRLATPAAARNNNFKFGLAKFNTNDRAGGVRNKGIPLPFVSEVVNYRVPNGWVYPILAGFRANLRNGQWLVPLPKILNDVIDDLVGVCVNEHRNNNMRPEFIGKRESAYAQCYTRVQLYLAKRNLLS